MNNLSFHTKDEILALIWARLPESRPIFVAMFTKHEQYLKQGRYMEARAVGIGILEGARALARLPNSEPAPTVDSSLVGLL
jgi:hypothetical protein